MREELNIHNYSEIIVDYTCKSTQYLLRLNDTRVLKEVYEYIPTGRRYVRRPKTD